MIDPGGKCRAALLPEKGGAIAAKKMAGLGPGHQVLEG
jgi:hypothetical protein